MAVSHICLACGTDLARVRAFRDPHYGLPLVVCPGCSAAVARSKERLTARWREGMRIRAAIRAMLLRMLAAMLLMGASVGVIFVLEDAAMSRGQTVMGFPAALLRGDPGWIADDDWVAVGLFLAAWLGVQASVGMLLSIGLAHWRPRILAWIAWAVVLGVFLSLTAATYPVRAAWGRLLSDPVAYDGPTFDMWASRVVLALGAMTFAGVGVPLGKAAILGVEQWRRMKFRARRRRCRREKGYGG